MLLLVGTVTLKTIRNTADEVRARHKVLSSGAGSGLSYKLVEREGVLPFFLLIAASGEPA